MLYFNRKKDSNKSYDKEVKVFVWNVGSNEYSFLVVRTNSNDIRNLVEADLKHNDSLYSSGARYYNSADITGFVKSRAKQLNLELENCNLRDCYRNICDILLKEGCKLHPLNKSKILHKVFEQAEDNYNYFK